MGLVLRLFYPTVVSYLRMQRRYADLGATDLLAMYNIKDEGKRTGGESE